MNKIAKASIAGAAGVILLMGGAGSLAYWNNSASLGGTSTTVTAGQLKLASKSDGAWSKSFNGGASSAGLPTKVVPGDSIVYSESFTVTAEGDNLKFRVATTAPTYTGTLNAALQAQPVTVTAYDGATTPAVVTPDASGTYTVSQNVKTLKVSVPFSWAFGTQPGSNTTGDNAYQNATGTIGATAATVVITQVVS